jgi:hypothetical protein
MTHWRLLSDSIQGPSYSFGVVYLFSSSAVCAIPFNSLWILTTGILLNKMSAPAPFGASMAKSHFLFDPDFKNLNHGRFPRPKFH